MINTKKFVTHSNFPDIRTFGHISVFAYVVFIIVYRLFTVKHKGRITTLTVHTPCLAQNPNLYFLKRSTNLGPHVHNYRL